MAQRSLLDLGEQEIIKMLAEEFGIEELEDASSLENDHPLLSTCDMMIESTDIPQNTNPLFWGHRYVTCNVSDMSAMGCQPRWMMVSLGLREDLTVASFRKMLQGMTWAANEAQLEIIGGDTNQSSEIILSGFIVGEPFTGSFSRSGATPGDGLFVTGRPGSAALGLSIIQSNADVYFECPDILEEEIQSSAPVVGAFLAPQIRLEETKKLAEMDAPTSCIDVSDGLSTDAGHLSKQSGVRIVIEESKIPFTQEARSLCSQLDLNPTDLALNGGDDFELLFTAPLEFEDQLMEEDIAQLLGTVEEGEGTFIRREDGNVERLKSRGYQHFMGKGN